MGLFGVSLVTFCVAVCLPRIPSAAYRHALPAGPDSVDTVSSGASGPLAHPAVVVSVDLNGADLEQSSPSRVPCHPDALAWGWVSKGVGLEPGRAGVGPPAAFSPHVWAESSLSRDLPDLC